MKLATLLIAGAIFAAPAQAAPITETAILVGRLLLGHAGGVRTCEGRDERRRASGFAPRSPHTSHAEAVKISFDPSQISYSQLLQIYFTVAHDPTEIDRQGPDEGHSYRSAIFPQTPDQERFARAFIARLNGAHIYKAPIATRLERGLFEAVGADQQHFAKKHPTYSYIVVNDVPKVADLKKKFPTLYKA